MLNALKFCALLVANFAVALMGPAVLDATIGRVIPAHTLATVLWKVWSLNILFAAVIGFGMWRSWQTKAAIWTWTVPTLWLAIFIFAFVNSGQSSVFSPSPTSQVASLFSGRECVYNNSAVGCRYFFVCTVPFIRGVAYSVGAFLSSLIFTRSAATSVA